MFSAVSASVLKHMKGIYLIFVLFINLPYVLLVLDALWGSMVGAMHSQKPPSTKYTPSLFPIPAPITATCATICPALVSNLTSLVGWGLVKAPPPVFSPEAGQCTMHMVQVSHNHTYC